MISTPRGNPNNLVDNSQLTPEYRKERASKAGKASVEAKRKKKLLSTVIQELLNNPVSANQPKIRAILQAYGIDPDEMTYQSAMVVTMITKAISGNVQAADWVVKNAGIDPKFKLDLERFRFEKEQVKKAEEKFDIEDIDSARAEVYADEKQDT